MEFKKTNIIFLFFFFVALIYAVQAVKVVSSFR